MDMYIFGEKHRSFFYLSVDFSKFYQFYLVIGHLPPFFFLFFFFSEGSFKFQEKHHFHTKRVYCLLYVPSKEEKTKVQGRKMREKKEI